MSIAPIGRRCRLLRSPPVVLIVAGDQALLAMQAFGLLAMGFQPVVVQNADDGFARACEFNPDVIVVDVDTVAASGWQLAHRLRSDTRTRNAGIIALTGNDSGPATQQAADVGFDRLLLKPCAPDSLALAIREVFAHRRLVTEAARSR